MNENSIPFSFINYAAHCMAWLSYGKRLWPSAAGATCYLARKPPQEKGSREPISHAGRTTTKTFLQNSEPHFKTRYELNTINRN